MAVLILVVLALGGTAFVCLLLSSHTPSINEGALMAKTICYNGTLSGFDRVGLDVHNINGIVTVKEGDGDTYNISLSTEGTDADYGRYVVSFNSTQSSGKKVLVIDVNDTAAITFPGSRYSADITVIVPKNKLYGMDLSTANGRVAVGNFTCSQVAVSVANGRITSSADTPVASYSTANGDIDVTTSSKAGNITASTANGGIAVYVPRGAGIYVDASSINGKISTGMPIEITDKGMFSLSGKTSGYNGGLYLKLSTLNGNIAVGEF